jgi:hypothetical protein
MYDNGLGQTMSTTSSNESMGPAVSIAEYAAELTRRGTRVLPGAPGTFWISHETGSVMRLPIFHTVPPSRREIREVLWRAPAALASHLLEPDDRHPANAWLYLCTDRTYALDKLAPAVRRNVRRGLRELSIGPITSEHVMAHGVQAFCDTRRRNGLSDGTPEEFHRQFGVRASCPGHVFWGAWRAKELAAFVSVIEVDDWTDLIGFSMNAHLSLRPNDAMIFRILCSYLTEGACRVVSYGVSSIQTDSSLAGLHAFKRKLGFEARPVHRAFVPHALVRPFANRLTLLGVKAARRLRPGDCWLRKAEGVLAYMVGQSAFPEFAASGTSED